MLLNDLPINTKAKILKINLPKETTTRFFNIGIRESCDVWILRYSPFKDLLEIKSNETFLAIRVSEAKFIEVKMYE